MPAPRSTDSAKASSPGSPVSSTVTSVRCRRGSVESAGSSATRSTSQSAQWVNPSRYSPPHSGQNISGPPFDGSPRVSRSGSREILQRKSASRRWLERVLAGGTGDDQVLRLLDDLQLADVLAGAGVRGQRVLPVGAGGLRLRAEDGGEGRRGRHRFPPHLQAAAADEIL